MGVGGGGRCAKNPKIRDSYISFCQITSLVRMRILTCIYMYIYLYFTQILCYKGVFMCIVSVPGKTVCGQTKFCFMSMISYYFITLLQPPFREGIEETENRFF